MEKLDNFKKAARRWMKALRAGSPDAETRIRQAYPAAPAHPNLRDVQHAIAREQGLESWVELRRYLAAAQSAPDLVRHERLAADILSAYNLGDLRALERFHQVVNQTIPLDSFRANVDRGLEWLQARSPGQPLTLAHVRRLIAHHAGFESWTALAEALQIRDQSASAHPPAPPFQGDPMQPVELRATFPMELRDGQYATTTEVWAMLCATRAGDLAAVRKLAERNPGLIRCEHNDMPPLQLAVREGYTEIAEFLLQRGAYDPKFVTYPYKETIHTLAEDRNYTGIARLLDAHRTSEFPKEQSVHGPGHIDFSSDPRQADRGRLEKLIDADALHAVEKLAEAQPDLIHDPLLFWGEGILSSPCNSRRLKMIELLLSLGARVPDVAKWAPFYYFKHLDVAERLLAAGMNARHMNWHRTTLLHHMAWEGDLAKAALLLDRGAEIDAIDDEFRSTPLGLAAKAGRHEMVTFLLSRGADPNRCGAAWASPLAWARKKGHSGIASDLLPLARP